MTQKESDTSVELQPRQATTGRDNESSGVYTYAYDHMVDGLAAFLHVHLRNRQELYSIRNQLSNSRPSSIPPTQAPHPLDQTPPSIPLIMSYRANDEIPENLQFFNTGDEYLEPIGQFHTAPLFESSFYEEIADNDRTPQYSEIA